METPRHTTPNQRFYIVTLVVVAVVATLVWYYFGHYMNPAPPLVK